jgi:hypothetical protein
MAGCRFGDETGDTIADFLGATSDGIAGFMRAALVLLLSKFLPKMIVYGYHSQSAGQVWLASWRRPVRPRCC